MSDDHIVLDRKLLIPLEDITTAMALYRRRIPLTQTEVADRAGHCAKWVSELEREVYSPRLSRLLKHAEALDLDVRVVLLPKKAKS